MTKAISIKFVVALFTILVIGIMSSCSMLKNSFGYKDKTKVLVENILSENYDAALNSLALNRITVKESTKEDLKKSLIAYRKIIVEDFGNDLDYVFIRAQKKWSTDENTKTPEDCTEVQIQYSNGSYFGVFVVFFDDISGNIMSLKSMDLKKPVPNMLWFWIFGLVALLIPVFNIFVIIKIKKNYKKRNWLRYISIFFFNIPSITFSAVNGFSIHLLSFQILLGISFSYMGYIGSMWTVGIPLAGIFWFVKIWSLEQKLKAEKEVAV